MHAAHHIVAARVLVPGNAILIFADLRGVELANGPTPQAVIVIQNPDFGFEIVLHQLRTEMAGYEFDFVFLTSLQLGHRFYFSGSVTGFPLPAERRAASMICTTSRLNSGLTMPSTGFPERTALTK